MSLECGCIVVRILVFPCFLYYRAIESVRVATQSYWSTDWEYSESREAETTQPRNKERWNRECEGGWNITEGWGKHTQPRKKERSNRECEGGWNITEGRGKHTLPRKKERSNRECEGGWNMTEGRENHEILNHETRSADTKNMRGHTTWQKDARSKIDGSIAKQHSYEYRGT